MILPNRELGYWDNNGDTLSCQRNHFNRVRWQLGSHVSWHWALMFSKEIASNFLLQQRVSCTSRTVPTRVCPCCLGRDPGVLVHIHTMSLPPGDDTHHQPVIRAEG
jgi:hypothetical protein